MTGTKAEPFGEEGWTYRGVQHECNLGIAFAQAPDGIEVGALTACKMAPCMATVRAAQMQD